MGRIRRLLACFQPSPHAVKTAPVKIEAPQLKADASSHSTDADTVSSCGALEEPTSAPSASAFTRETAKASLPSCQLSALTMRPAVGLTAAKSDDEPRLSQAQSLASSCASAEISSNGTVSVQSLAAGMLAHDQFLGRNDKPSVMAGFLSGTIVSPFHTSAAVPFGPRERHEDIVVVITNSTGGTGTLQLTTEDSPTEVPSDFAITTNTRPISFASTATQSKGDQQCSSMLSLKQGPESVRSTDHQLCGDGPDRQSCTAVSALAVPRSPSVQSRPSMQSHPSTQSHLSTQSFSMRLSLPSIGSGPMPPAPGDISRRGSGCTTTISSTCGTGHVSALVSGYVSTGTILNSGSNTGPVPGPDLSFVSTIERPSPPPPRLTPHLGRPEVPSPRLLATTSQLAFGPLDPLASVRQALLPVPGMPREALPEGGSAQPHPADKFLRFTDLETCWAELRDLSFIGSGASGYVYNGMWCGMPVAVKFMLSSDMDEVYRQQREAALSRLASHPHLVQTYAVAAAQLTPAHFHPDLAQRRISSLSHGDLLSTTAAGGTVAELYGIASLSPAPSTTDASRCGVSAAAAQMLSVSAASPPTPQSVAPIAAQSRRSCDEPVVSPFVNGRSAFALACHEPVQSTASSGTGSSEHPVAAAAAATSPTATQRRQPPAHMFRQQLRNRLSGNMLASGDPFWGAINSTPNAIMNDMMAHGPVLAPESSRRSPATAQVVHKGAAFSVTADGAMPAAPPQPEPRPVQGQQQPQQQPQQEPPQLQQPQLQQQAQAQPQVQRPRFSLSPARRMAAVTNGHAVPVAVGAAVAGSNPALATNISGVDIEVSASFQMDKADSFEVNATDANGLMLFQAVDVLTHMGARPGQWLTVVIMEEMDRGSLHRAIHGGLFHPTASPLSKRHRVRGIVRTLVEVAQSMAHLHSAGLVHGDLKPANVLLKANARDLRGFIAKVSDFGVTRALAEGVTQATVSTSDWGTVIYTAPEVFNGRAGMPSDVFSFGALTWHLTTGQLPHEDINPFAVMLAVSRGELELDWPDTVPKPLRKLGMLCMQYDPAARPKFAAIARALLKLETRMRLQSAGGSRAGNSAQPGSTPAAGSAGLAGQQLSTSMPSTPTVAAAGRCRGPGGGGGRRLYREMMHSLDLLPTPAAADTAAAKASGSRGW